MDIIVLCGGLCAERDVSITSGVNAAKALRSRGHRAVLVDLFFGYTGAYGDPREIFNIPQDDNWGGVGLETPDLETVRASRVQDNDSVMGDNVIKVCAAADIVFLALHGDIGENGHVQAALDIAGIKYTGSGYLGSAIAMDKEVTKKLFAANDILTPPGIVVSKNDKPYEDVGFPCVVKPCSGGSSVGTSIVQSAQEYAAALETAFEYEKTVIVERYIKGRELTVGVLGGRAMPIIEIIPKTGFYDYKNKYQAGLTLEICPAPVDDKVTAAVQALAERAMRALYVDAYCRADMMLAETGELYCLEVNTLPGMTETSLIPQMGREMGLSFAELCEKLIEVSYEKYESSADGECAHKQLP